jgi:hypothetical protein
MYPIGRRDFLGIAAASMLPAIDVLRKRARTGAGARLVVTHCRHSEEVIDRVLEGMDMGVEEAQRAAEMFGGSVTSRFLALGGSPIADQPYPPPSPIDPVNDAIQIVVPGVMADDLWRHTIASARAAGAIVFNANARSGAPYARCERHVFHIMPSPATLETVRASRTAGARGSSELWSPALTRFGADTLNKRFRARRGTRMDASAWAGWFAVKCAWEGALASKATTASQLIAWLRRSETRFDGHKGQPLRFNASHELEQPVYIVDGGELVAEIDSGTLQSKAAKCG